MTSNGMTYDQAIEYIHSTYRFGSKLGLENVKALLERLGNPQKHLKFIHVAGTNGKGSTCAFLHAILMEAGYTVGLYTSPYIEVFEERMRVNHHMIASDALARHVETVKGCIDTMVGDGFNHPTEFEVVTAVAMLYFKEMCCDVVVLEVGLGGRLDATNAIDVPLASVITPVDLDHTQYLGETYGEVAYEKAGIIKSGGAVISASQHPEAMAVIRGTAAERGNRLIEVDASAIDVSKVTLGRLEFSYRRKSYHTALFGVYQAENAALAIEVIDYLNASRALEVPESAVEQGIAQTRWMGRLEHVSRTPDIIIDGAHNVHGVKGLFRSMERVAENRPIIGIVGVLSDKDVRGMVRVAAPHLKGVIVTAPDNPRALSEKALAEYFSEEEVPVLGAYASAHEAVQAIEKGNTSDAPIYLIFGSLYMIGAIRQEVLKG